MTHRYPIIYIRGFTMTEAERNKTVADPFCGFNYGSTLYRAAESKQQRADKFFFESPLVRLSTEYQYQPVYHNGDDIVDAGWQGKPDEDGNIIPGIPAASIIIYRYYDDDSTFLGDGNSRSISEYAAGLNALILRVKQLVLQYPCAEGSLMRDSDFRCYLVAYSMGGLIARAFLQSTEQSFHQAQQAVAKLFTYATPHNGIDILGMNVPGWLTAGQMNTFNRAKMRQYLNLQTLSPHFDHRVDLIPESALPADRIFCMIGTNRSDYEPLQGMLRNFVGHGSDGLVLIDNASLWGVKEDNMPVQVATAYAFRSHSGYFGIVNSEEAYQNLVRFLFGDVRVDVWADIHTVTLPPAIEPQAAKVSGLYQFEFRAAPKGKRWFLTRRASVEDSPACRSHAQLTATNHSDRQVYLSSLFLSRHGKVDQVTRDLCYSMTFSAKVPDYKIERKFWSDGHHEGADLFRDMAIITLTPPPRRDGIGDWTVKYGWSENPTEYQHTLNFHIANDRHELRLPFENSARPGIRGAIRMIVRPWS
ncbi:hypothetical protein [Winslowiella iniecta]|uniref:DUF676 domain-containing protein n=1 Tax=Winslowiella iniecta TaxID=1560201 RepID=A0A0L7T9M4_9GAMM|nr:hypothetical protein [Winslowiella iniecta]KOC91464.1 hypothetical protein NG43_15670 [Winslowiella iniecta]KOC92075.1 hypothetical protein NG42_02355 [Winslowiella iniecta]